MEKLSPPSGRPLQRPLFCACGSLPYRAGKCEFCYRQWRHSRSAFGGNRERVLQRDRCTCQGCGQPGQRIIHHRRPGRHRQDLLVTLCRACHARLHRLRAMYKYVPPALVPLWAEHHPDTPVQLQFGFSDGAPLPNRAPLRRANTAVGADHRHT